MLLHEAPCSSQLGAVTVGSDRTITRSDNRTINLQHHLGVLRQTEKGTTL